MSSAENTAPSGLGIDLTEFTEHIVGPKEEHHVWAEGRAYHLYRILTELTHVRADLRGPTLDVASGGAALLRPIKRFFPEILPYTVAELVPHELRIDGETVPLIEFECDKDRLPLEDNSVGVIFFCDVIEHLIIDPVWTLLEFNRVLRHGGHLVVSTPNAAGVDRVFNILSGINPINENQYKPRGIYQRHNREWTVHEIGGLLTSLGFKDEVITTCPDRITNVHAAFLQLATEARITTLPHGFFGPDVIGVFSKQKRMTLDCNLPDEIRWPAWLYTEIESYHKRPEVYPKLWGKDYC